MTDEGQGDVYRLAGDRLGKFTILSELGRGSMGVVYEAFQEDLKRKVALKVLPANIALEQKQVERFRREAESAARLNQDNIIQIYEVGHVDNTHYFAMEMIDGGSMLEACRLHDDPIREGARIARDCARGLSHAHDNGVIHRDIKPTNILVARDGKVIITDFGLARMNESMSLTSTDAIVGTPKYMSPEQILRGQKPLDGRTDVYSLGASLYEVLAGRPPIEAPSVQAFIRAVLEERPPHPRKFNKKIPLDLATIVLRCLEKEPRDRYPDAGAMADDLDRFLRGERIRAKPKGVLARAYGSIQRHKVMAALSAVAIVAVIASAFFLGSAGRAEHEKDLSRLLLTIRTEEDLDKAVTAIDELFLRYPRRLDVTAARADVYHRRGSRRLALEDPDFEGALADMRAGGVRDRFWYLMALVETRSFQAAEVAAGSHETSEPLRALTLARLQVERNRQYAAALDLLADIEEESHFSHLTRAEAHYGLGLENEALAPELARQNYQEARNALALALTSSSGIPQEWLRVRIRWTLSEVRRRLGDKSVNLADALIGFGGTAQESLRRLTRFVGGESEGHRDNAIAFVRSVLDLAGLKHETLAAVMKEEAENRLAAARDKAGQVRAQLLLSVAYMSGNLPNEALGALDEADNIGADSDLLGAHVHWGQSLLQRTVNKDITQALAFGFLACNLARDAYAKKAIDNLTPIVRNCVLLAEEALAQKRSQDVARAVDMLKGLVDADKRLSEACRGFLEAAAAFGASSSSSESREPPR
ncbi:MAG: serine/threonine-protein kinase [Planctomycetota bacterium]|nr:serine/threonine-protein kinase [Planctomycetota bacterium]